MDHAVLAEKMVDEKSVWLLEDNVLVIRDWDKVGRLTRKAVVLKPRSFHAKNDPSYNVTLLLCSCDNSVYEHEILDTAPVSFGTTIDLLHFHQKRMTKACAHVHVVLQNELTLDQGESYADILNTNEPVDLDVIEKPLAFLSPKPRLIAVFDGLTWGVLGAKNWIVLRSFYLCKKQNQLFSFKKIP